MSLSDKTRQELLHRMCDQQIRVAHSEARLDAVNMILYECDEAYRASDDSQWPITPEVRRLVNALRDAEAEVTNRWERELDYTRW